MAGKIDQKAFLEGFLQYLQSYYGQPNSYGRKAPMDHPNHPKMHLFQDSNPLEMPSQLQQSDPQRNTLGPNQGGMSDLLQAEQFGNQLNTMFSRRNSGGMN